MKTKFLMSAAAIAVLMAGGMANAQSPGGTRGENPAAGASGGASVGGGAASGGGMSAPSAKGAAEGGASGAVESHGSQKGGMSAQGEGSAKGHAREAQDNNKMGKSPSSHTATDSKNSERMNKNTASDSKSGAEGKTTGNAATAAKGAPPVEKRSQITSAIKKEKVTAVTNVNFNISVGTRVPASVHFYPVPANVIAIYPEWRGYEFILVGGRYVIVAPETHEIIYILS